MFVVVSLPPPCAVPPGCYAVLRGAASLVVIITFAEYLIVFLKPDFRSRYHLQIYLIYVREEVLDP